ncbi:MAG: 7-carboxy-7-deazaguanine synthase QueE [Balneolaceae bacterium]
MFNGVDITSEVERDFLSPKYLDEIKYPLMEDFYTIQGEGVHTGKPAYFIRLAGCDVKCWWCDVKESWDESLHPKIKTGDIIKRANESGAKIAVITGGEPLLHNLDPLTLRLKQEGFQIHIETSGSSPLTGYLDWITLSPKRFKKPVDDIFPYVDELKVVVLKNKDLEWAETNAEKCPATTKLLLQPEWDTPSSVKLIIEYVKKHPHWGISLQTHKFMKIP